ncbi:DBIRD complex subunit ZNF326-like [Lissotriton helveticus]
MFAHHVTCLICILSANLMLTNLQDYGGMQRPGIVVDYQTSLVFGGPAGRGMKRKMMQPLNKPVGGAFVGKKPKLTKPGSNGNAVKKGVSADDHMMKVETVHCSACSVYVPALHSSVQQHEKSSDHAKRKLGENPFEIVEQTVESVVEETTDTNDEDNDQNEEEDIDGENDENEEQIMWRQKMRMLLRMRMMMLNDYSGDLATTDEN